MEATRERPPEYVSTNPDELRLPSVPRHEVGTVAASSDVTLPGFHSFLAGIPDRTASAYDSNGHAHQSNGSHMGKLHDQTRSFPASSFASQPRSSLDQSLTSPTETCSRMSMDDHTRRSTSVVSLEDPDVRLAAEALSGLGNPDFARNRSVSRASTRTVSQASPSVANENSEEPLLELLVEAHPWVGGTVAGSLSAYNSTKGYTPRFVQYSANLIERNTVNTVSVVGRLTGVESGLRRYLGSRRPSDLERRDSRENYKSRRAAAHGDDMDIDEADESALDDATSSSSRPREYLPAYKNNQSKPPSYREEVSPNNAERQSIRSRPSQNRTWSSKFLIGTSGLGVALSETSLKSLTFCVTLLTKASEHVEIVMKALKMVLHDYEKAQEERQREQARRQKEIEAGLVSHHQATQEDVTRALADRIQRMCDDIMGTLKTVVDKVSAYTGGALPENARNVVKTQLLSIPQRWGRASEHARQVDGADAEANAGEDVPRKTANRMLLFAQEGLEMMATVNDVVKITLQSAEEWLATLGRRQRPQEPVMQTPESDARAGDQMDES